MLAKVHRAKALHRGRNAHGAYIRKITQKQGRGWTRPRPSGRLLLAVSFHPIGAIPDGFYVFTSPFNGVAGRQKHH